MNTSVADTTDAKVERFDPFVRRIGVGDIEPGMMVDAEGDYVRYTDYAALQAEVARLNAIINTPQADDFLRAVSVEAEHQRQRWGTSHDGGKAPPDWFWLIGYLAGKALHAHIAGSVEKAEHHIITTAAACANWHRAMFGRTDMRPGIDGDAAMGSANGQGDAADTTAGEAAQS